MVSRLILISVFLISAAPPKHADFEKCVMIHMPPLLDTEKPMEGNAPVSDLASWKF